MTPDAATARVKQAASIVKVVGQYVRLKPAGTDCMKGLCPFHSEKTPSFTVRPSLNLWKCFGCHSGGDVFTFVRLIENCSFLDARKELAEWYGIDLGDRPLTRQERELARAKHAAAEAMGAASASWWEYVRTRYRMRYELMVGSARIAADAEDEVAYLHYSSRAWRWGTILLRMEEREPVAAMRAYHRIQYWPAVRRVVEQAKRLDALWGRIAAKAADLTEEQLNEVIVRMHVKT